MSENLVSPRARRGRLALLAIGVGALTASLLVIVPSLALQEFPRNLGNFLTLYIFISLFVSIPFLLLAFLGVGHRPAWLTGVLLTVALWGYVLFDVLVRQGEGGASIGLGWLVLASPILISAACLFAARKEFRR